MATKTFVEITSEDIIDVRDLIERFEELECEIGDIESTEDFDALLAKQNNADLYDEFAEIKITLEELKGDAGFEEWEGDWYPSTLIEEDYMETYLDEMVGDCYELPKYLPSWMKITYDYDALKMDYTTIEIANKTYYYR